MRGDYDLAMLPTEPNRLRLGFLASAVLVTAASTLSAQDASTGQAKTVVRRQPGELGKVAWLRDEAVAQKQAKASAKPVLVLFQEVPG